ncbi:MAG: prepilin-type N-terminal cleavage/methylation domain-containing protein [Candidatus Sedimenticola sp. (ex Thyasira tokunagai)]
MTNSSLFKIFRKQGGFTMVELAIVLVIAGIILTAVLKGTDMINKAKIERITSDLKGLQGMVLEHEKRTSRLPGDCNENGVIGYTAFTANAIDNNQYGYNVDSDPDVAGRCDSFGQNETNDANRVWSDLRKANIVDPSRTNINLTKHTLTDFYAVGNITESTSGASHPINVIVAHGLPLWLAKGIDVAIDGPQSLAGEELFGGARGRIRLYATEDGTVSADGAQWPVDNVGGGDYQFVAITYQFDTRMAQPTL